MFNIRNLFYGKRKYLFGLVLLSFVFIICAAFIKGDSDDFDNAKREVLLRRIGHELLLKSGDSTSRVLPVKKITENEYQIMFENELTFLPDSLVSITKRLLIKDAFTQDYVVSVLNCDNSGVAYGYSISKSIKDDIVPCQGREQPRGCYVINIKFKPTNIANAKNGYLLGGFSLLVFAGFIFFRPVKPKTRLPESKDTEVIGLGAVLFDVKNKKLILNEKTTDLTATETRLLFIFASSPNETIERSRLQKEIWEDEGVIVGRSLDMFISKLRKKLEDEPNANIVVVRGKGYKLEISS